MKYERIKYPDGQISVKILEYSLPYLIKERINSYEDLMFVRSIAEVFTRVSGETPHLEIPCMFGQRSDRVFGDDNSFDLKMIAEVINAGKFGTVTVLDPHSDVCLALINNSYKLSSFPYVQNAVHHLYRPETGINTCNFTLVSPDAGAYKKVFEYGEKLGLPVVAAVKHRDSEGKIDLKFMGDVKDKHCLIIDDLCDGGYTFLLLGKALKEQGAQKVYLYVSHGYFSKGFSELRKVIDHIYCTNSVKDLGDVEFDGVNTHSISDYVTQYKVI